MTPLTRDEAMQLTRYQFVQRLEETQKYWEKRRYRPSGADQAAFNDYHGLYTLLDPAGGVTAALNLVRDNNHGPAGGGYWDQRMDGSPARPYQRLQRRRTAGWRKPYGCIDITRGGGFGGEFGNPFIGADAANEFADYLLMRSAVAAVVGSGDGDQRTLWQGIHYPSRARIRETLAGWDLLCWCPETVRCHGDVLLWVANGYPCRVDGPWA